jgi:NADPH:quinone reductase-like Zn-dependent oxidoreductase
MLRIKELLMTKTVRIHQTGGPEVLRIEDLPIGDPGPHEIRIRVESIGLNRSEAMYRAGRYLGSPKLPSLMGYEACGIVESVRGCTGARPAIAYV